MNKFIRNLYNNKNVEVSMRMKSIKKILKRSGFIHVVSNLLDNGEIMHTFLGKFTKVGRCKHIYVTHYSDNGNKSIFYTD